MTEIDSYGDKHEFEPVKAAPAPSPSASSMPFNELETMKLLELANAQLSQEVQRLKRTANPTPSVPPDQKAFDRAWYRYDMYPTEYRDDGEIKAYVDPDTEKAWRVCSFLILQANGARK